MQAYRSARCMPGAQCDQGRAPTLHPGGGSRRCCTLLSRLGGQWHHVPRSASPSRDGSSSSSGSSSSDRPPRAPARRTDRAISAAASASELALQPWRSSWDSPDTFEATIRLRPCTNSSGAAAPAATAAAAVPSSALTLVLLCASCVALCYMDRSNMSTAILPMSQSFGWDKAFQGVVMSSFFVGYALTQTLGGYLADRYGGKPVLAGGVAVWSLCSALIPAAAAAGMVPLLAIRVLLGIGEGVAFPAIHSLLARNVPCTHQSAAVGVVTAAAYVGTAASFGLGPLIISNFGCWRPIFWLFSSLALAWLPMWLTIRVKNNVQQRDSGAKGRGHVAAGQTSSGADACTSGRIGGGSALASSSSPGITAAPAAATAVSAAVLAVPASVSAVPAVPPVVSGSGGGASSSGRDASISSGKGSAPALGRGFWALLKRREVWAICIAQYTWSWGMYSLLSWLPTFFADFYGVRLKDLAMCTMAPYLVQGAMGTGAGFLADRLLASGHPVRRVRVGLQVVGMLGPAACLLLAVSPLVAGSASAASFLITCGLGLSALTLGGVSSNHLDIAPRHAGAVFGVGNTAATLAGCLSVPLTGLLLQATGSWPLVFGIAAAHYVVGAALWAAWSGDSVLPEDTVAA